MNDASQWRIEFAREIAGWYARTRSPQAAPTSACVRSLAWIRLQRVVGNTAIVADLAIAAAALSGRPRRNSGQ